MLSKSIIVLAVFLVHFSSALKCYECKESKTLPKDNNGGPCFTPNSSTNTTDENDALYCVAEVARIKDSQGKEHGNIFLTN
jgi:hypothetical protein